MDVLSWPLLVIAAAPLPLALFLHFRMRRGVALRLGRVRARCRGLQRRYLSALQDNRALLDQMPEVILVFDRQWPKLVFANRQALELFRCRDIQELTDRWLSLPDCWLPAPYSLADFEQWLASARSFGADRKEWCFAAGQDAGIWLDCQISNIVFAARPARLLSGTNIHHHKMESVAEGLREQVLTGINRGQPVDRLLDITSKLIEVRQPRARCVISLYDPAKDALVTCGNSAFARSFRSRVSCIPVRYGATSIGTAAYTRARVICESLHQDHRWQGYRQVFRESGMDASWSEPVFDQEGNLLAIITLFSETWHHPDDDQLRSLSSAVSLLSLVIERQQWKQALEVSSANERFIRDLGMEVTDIPADNYARGLSCLCRRVQAHYGLGGLCVWARDPDSSRLVPLAGTSGSTGSVGDSACSQPRSIPVKQLEAVLAGPAPEYLTPTDELHSLLQHSGHRKPVLVIPLYDDAQSGSLLGFLAVESRFQLVPEATIAYLRVIGAIFKTSLIRRRLMLSLSVTLNAERDIREKLENELVVARSIQMSMVPGSGQFLKRFHSWTIEAWLSPAKAVGGDFYDVIPLPDGRLLVAVGDVSGKGVPAALFMARTVSLLNFLARTCKGDLPRIATSLNEELCRSNDACMFVTMMMGIVDPGSGDTRWINAGHNPLLHAGSPGPAHLCAKSMGPPFGLYETVSYGVERITVRPGQCLTLYTDGLTEAFDADGQVFGEERLARMGYRARRGADSFLTYVRGQLMEFVRDVPQSDDVTLLTVDYSNKPL